MSELISSDRQGRHHRDASLDTAASSTPTRPPRPSRASTYARSPGDVTSPVNPARRSLLGRQSGPTDATRDDVDRTPRKLQTHGLPTPPLSEATSSASGSVGRARKDSAEEPAAAAKTLAMIPAAEARVARSASATSSRTGSDTVGARSPIDHQSSFQSPRVGADSPSNGPSPRFTAATLGRRRGAGLHSALADTPERNGAPPAMGRAVNRAQSSLGMRSSFADEGRRSSLNINRAGDEDAASETPDRSERKKRSAMHEQDVTQIRSESRLGHSDPIDEDDTSPRKTAHQSRYSPRKSAALSRRSRYHDEPDHDAIQTSPQGEPFPLRSPPPTYRSVSRASAGRRHEDASLENRPATSIGSRGDYGVARRSLGAQMNPEEVASASARRRSLRAAEASAADEASMRHDPSSATRKSSSGRSPLPLEFRLPNKEARKAWREAYAREQSDSVTSDGSDAGNGLSVTSPPQAISPINGSVRAPSRQTTTNASTESSSATRATYRRKRYASDAQADELSPIEHETRSSGQGGRVSVDARSANRYLTKGPLQGTPQSARRGSHASEIGSPSEEARMRKISTSSSRSQKSSGGASELHRTASRASMRKVHGRDVFDDERVGELKDAGGTGRPGWWNEVDELRNEIEALAVASSKASIQGSRSPSVQSSRTHSALGLHRTPLDTSRFRRAPMTEPRNSRHDRSSTISDLGSGDRSERSAETEGQRYIRPYSRATLARSHTPHDANGRAPQTPDPHGALRLAAGSRASVIQSATLPATARFPSGGHGMSTQRVRSEGSIDGSNPVHDRNMRNAFDMFERYFCAAPSTATPSVGGAGPDSLEMVASFSEVVATASELNAGLRILIQVALEAQVDAEISERNGHPASEQTLECFARLDRDLTSLLKHSDEQVRNLTDGLMAVTRAERERDRQRKAAVAGDQGAGARSASRMSSIASPADELRRSLDSRSSTELRRSSSTLIREPASPAGTIVERSSIEKHADRFRAIDRSPYSPLQGKASATTFGGTLTASQIRSMAPASNGSSHSRSASEFSPQTRLRREKSTVMDTVKMPALSPRRPKLSFPSVSNATASFNPTTAQGDAQLVDSPILADGIAFPTAQDASATHSLSRARRLAREPTELPDAGAAPFRSTEARSAVHIAGSPFASGHSRRNTVAGTGAEKAEASGLGIDPASPEATRRRGVDEVKRSSRSERPPRPPRHDLMRRDTEDEAPHLSTAGAEPSEDHAGEERDTSGISRLGSLSRSFGRSAARRISKTFAVGAESEGGRSVEEAQA
ncbi:uncharacterized protein PSFLO_01072 [Pseudozyma flocculosa]|uniref:Uncharacterized protein n=1 Tax=Pseudozyma flocculosa TaxID=84751 RepID=A0A5C3EWX8_9BASI|nr:uncharacterized protein PSFLO_01072 [Pseudozyma flocculosa]